MTSEKSPSKGKEVIVLASSKQIIQIDGKLQYDKKAQAWNTIRVKTEFLKKCLSCPKKTGSIPYKMLVHRNHEELKKTLKDIDEDNLPILLFLYKENKNDK